MTFHPSTPFQYTPRGTRPPGIVEKLIIMDAPHPAVFQKNAFRNYEQMKKSWYIFFFLLQNVPESMLSRNNFELLKYVFEISIKRKEKFTQKDVEGYVSSWSKEGGITGGINYYRSNLNAGFWGSLDQSIPFPKIKSPTLQIWEEQDLFLGKEVTEGTNMFDFNTSYNRASMLFVSYDNMWKKGKTSEAGDAGGGAV